MEDLDERGMLDETLVLVNAEFGRTPAINKNAGRDHWPWVYSLALAGAGVQAGTVYGASDNAAAYPADKPHDPKDMAATIYHLLGVDPQTDPPRRHRPPAPAGDRPADRGHPELAAESRLSRRVHRRTLLPIPRHAIIPVRARVFPFRGTCNDCHPRGACLAYISVQAVQVARQRRASAADRRGARASWARGC